MVEGVVVDFEGNFDELKEELEDEDFTKEVQFDTAGRGAGGGAGGAGAGGGASIFDALGGAEVGSDIATGPGGGGIAGRLAGMSSSLALIAGLLVVVVGFLALLEPVQQALGFIMRQFELMVIPLVVALMPLMEALRDFAVQVLKFFQNPQQFVSQMVNGLMRALAPMVNAVIAGLNAIPGVDIAPVSVPGAAQGTVGFRGTGDRGTQQDASEGPATDAVEAGVRSATLPMLGPASFVLAEASDEAVKERVSSMFSNTLGGDFFQ